MLNSVWNIRALRTNSGDDERIRNPAPLRHSGESRIVAPLPSSYESWNPEPLRHPGEGRIVTPLRHSGESRNPVVALTYVSVAFDPAGGTSA